MPGDPGETHLIDRPVSPPYPIRGIRIAVVGGSIVVERDAVQNSARRNDRCDIVRVFIDNVPIEVKAVNTAHGFLSHEGGVVAATHRNEKLETLRLAALVHVRL